VDRAHPSWGHNASNLLPSLSMLFRTILSNRPSSGGPQIAPRDTTVGTRPNSERLINILSKLFHRKLGSFDACSNLCKGGFSGRGKIIAKEGEKPQSSVVPSWIRGMKSNSRAQSVERAVCRVTCELHQGLPTLEACGHNVLVQYLLKQVMHWPFRAPCRLFRGVSASVAHHCDSNH
jgi:hypothetical protein